MGSFFELYDRLIAGISSDTAVIDTHQGDLWTAVETSHALGMAMTTAGNTAPKILSEPNAGMSLCRFAEACKSWNLMEASFGMAAVNAYYNTPARLEALNAYEPFERYCTHGLDLRGKHIGVVGHLNMPQSVGTQAASVRFLEQHPHPGDYPDSACDWLLPQCDLVIITASTLINKTLPHLLDLCRDAYTILAGPSCPMCPALFEFGIDRLAGLVVTDTDGMREKIVRNLPGPPYPLGVPFLLRRDSL